MGLSAKCFSANVTIFTIPACPHPVMTTRPLGVSTTRDESRPQDCEAFALKGFTLRVRKFRIRFGSRACAEGYGSSGLDYPWTVCVIHQAVDVVFIQLD